MLIIKIKDQTIKTVIQTLMNFHNYLSMFSLTRVENEMSKREIIEMLMPSSVGDIDVDTSIYHRIGIVGLNIKNRDISWYHEVSN